MSFRVEIPNDYCLSCRGCCRFSSADSVWRPYLAPKQALDWCRLGFERGAWMGRDHRLAVVRPPETPETVCRCLDPCDHRCRVYREAPWECRWYPFVVARDDGGCVWWGLHLACPFVQEITPRAFLRRFGAEAESFFSRSDTAALLARYPDLAMPKGSIDHECLWLGMIRLAETSACVAPSSLESLGFSRSQLSIDAPVALRLWAEAFDFHVAKLHGCTCLFACDRLGVYLFVPPFGEGDFEAALEEALQRMKAVNGPAGVSRVDHITAADLDRFPPPWRCREAGREWVYWRRDIARLRGRGFKSARHNRNRLESQHTLRLERMNATHEPDCEALFERWAAHRIDTTADPVETALIHETRSWHRRLRRFDDRDLHRWVVILDGRVVGYTIGYPLNEKVFVEAAEITDPRCSGLGAWVFHRLAQDSFVGRFDFINAMDDGGSERLRAVKRRWRPVLTQPWWTAVYEA